VGWAGKLHHISVGKSAVLCLVKDVLYLTGGPLDALATERQGRNRRHRSGFVNIIIIIIIVIVLPPWISGSEGDAGH